MTHNSLAHLGERIAIIGPSNSGKSTLAESLAKALHTPCLHLDQIAHIHGSKWVRKPLDDFVAEHDALVAREKWVVEGNYSVCMAQRFARADTVIWLDPPLWGCIFRYIKRCVRKDENRAGHLPGAESEFSMELIRYTLRNYPKNKQKYCSILKNYPHLKQLNFKKLITLEDLYA